MKKENFLPLKKKKPKSSKDKKNESIKSSKKLNNHSS